jgi:hypothetical protein
VSAGRWVVLALAVQYFLVAAAQGWSKNWPMATVYASYGVANLGLMMVTS